MHRLLNRPMGSAVAVVFAVAVVAGLSLGGTAEPQRPGDGRRATTVFQGSTTAATIVERRIQAGSDDAEESDSGKVTLNSSDLELVYDRSNQKVGLRFTGLAIPNGATITRAYLQFETDETQSEPTNLLLQGQAADNAATFTTGSTNISSRPRTAASASWSPPAWTLASAAGADQRTPDLAALVQEIVERPGWASGSALVIIVTGTGHRTARSYEKKPAGAALLHVELDAGPAVNRGPGVDAGADSTITLPAAATLDGTVTDDGLPGPPPALTTSWSVDSGPGSVAFLDAGAVDTSATFSTAGTYVLRLTASDGELSGTDSVQITVQPAPPPGAVTLEQRIQAGSDDAEESAGGSMYLTSSDVELVYDGSNQKVGLRFTGLAIPNGATITRAYVQFETDETQSEATTLLLQGQAADNAATFTTASGNVSGRPRTAASVTWSPPAWTLIGEAGANQRTPDLSALIQEIVSRPGWASGNALALVVTGTGHRTARAYEGRAAGAALLHVELTTGSPLPPVNTVPPSIAGTPEEGRTLSASTGSWNGTPPLSYAYQWLRCDPAGAACADIVPAGGSSHALTGADVGQTIRVAVTASNEAGSSTATSAQTAVVAPAGSTYPVIAAAGDLCGSPTSCAGTAALLGQLDPDRVLTLGDNAYEDGTLAEYMAYYDPNWGPYRTKTSPSPGNHEYNTAGGAGYFSYFGAQAPAAYYSFDVGSWHLVSLNGEISVSAGSAQETWLRADLAAHQGQCILAYWHEPRFSSGSVHGSDSSLDAFWRALYAAGGDIVLNGHEHHYERFAPQNPDGQADPQGIRQFVVGTGGWALYAFANPVANSEVRSSASYGVLKLTLRPGGYDWQFVPVAGSTFTDSGSGSC